MGQAAAELRRAGRRRAEMFLDIACCMLGKRVDRVLPAWGPGARSSTGELSSAGL